MTAPDDDPTLEKRWYWDDRNRKAHYPCAIDEDTVTMVSVWHRDEVEGGLREAILQPFDEIGPAYARDDPVVELFDSFRILPDDKLEEYDAL